MTLIVIRDIKIFKLPNGPWFVFWFSRCIKRPGGCGDTPRLTERRPGSRADSARVDMTNVGADLRSAVSDQSGSARILGP